MKKRNKPTKHSSPKIPPYATKYLQYDRPDTNKTSERMKVKIDIEKGRLE